MSSSAQTEKLPVFTRTTKWWVEGGHARYWDPLLALEALVSLASGVLLWIGWWDVIELIIPAGWGWRLAMIILGSVGLFSTRTLYDKKMLRSIRKGKVSSGERVDAAMLSSMELGSSCSDNSGRDRDGQLSPASSAEPSAAACDEDAQSTRGEPSTAKRLYFDAPRLDAKRCSSALFRILVSLTVWVGIWDLIDYSILPALTSACDSAGSNPGPMELLRSPGCIGIKLLLVLIGAIGLWSTRSLYGDETPRGAVFQRAA
jgi:hypothetical protein